MRSQTTNRFSYPLQNMKIRKKFFMKPIEIVLFKVEIARKFRNNPNKLNYIIH